MTQKAGKTHLIRKRFIIMFDISQLIEFLKPLVIAIIVFIVILFVVVIPFFRLDGFSIFLT